MATFPRKTGVTNLAHIDLANTLDFHIASTDWLKVLQKYANEIATYYVYNFTKHTADPVTSQVNFFLSLNYDQLQLTTDERGTIQQQREEVLTGYKLSALDTLLTSVEVWARGDDNLPESRVSETGVPQYHAINLVTGDHTWYELAVDIDQLITDNLNSIQDDFGINTMGYEFLLHWYEKFLYLS